LTEALVLAVLVGAENKVAQGIKAFHGSPHDFDQFSVSKIGTGEGAQAYGHGLYFAEAPETAGFYKDFLAKKADTPEYWESVKDRVPEFLGVGEQDELFKLKQKLAKNATNGPPLTAQETGRFDALNGRYREYYEAVDALKPKGHMYEVNIDADPEDFLDWDAPLSQQSEKVRQAFTNLHGPEDLANYADAPGRKWAGPAASERLRKAGIPGIKYLDGASRSAGQGSHNYVVFDDTRISIVRKFGTAALLEARS